MKDYRSLVISNGSIAEGIYEMRLSLPCPVSVKPGQFAMAGTGNPAQPLRRPLGIIPRTENEISLCYRIAGAGTACLTRLSAGAETDVLIPLGNGFDIRDGDREIAVIGGGVGIFPLVSALVSLKGKTFHSYMGFRGRDAVCLREEMGVSSTFEVVTDDGSEGRRMSSVDAFAEDIGKYPLDLIIACGPMPMFRALKKVLNDRGVGTRCLISLEERMGCGIGACLGCTCDTADGSRVRVCADGPVFDINDVALR